MKVTISSKGADEIIDKIRALQEKANVNSFDSILEKIANRVRSYIIDDYKLNGTIWREVNGNLETVSGDDVIVEKNGASYIVSIGKNTQPFDMNDGTFVNPYFFIEFGFGISGELNPVGFADRFGWEYNIRPHLHPWRFKGQDGSLVWTTGGKGVGAISTLINSAFQRIVNEVMAEERTDDSSAR